MNKKLLVSLIIVMVIVITGNFTFAVELKDLNLTAKEVGVYELKNLNPVYEKDAKKQVPVASLTKIMTAIVCLENVDMNEKVIVNLPEVKKYYDEEYSVAGLKDKQEISYYDLVETIQNKFCFIFIIVANIAAIVKVIVPVSVGTAKTVPNCCTLTSDPEKYENF